MKKLKLLNLSLIMALFSNCTSRQTPALSFSDVYFEAGACFGYCPVYNLKISADGKAVLDAERFNFTRNLTEKKEGIFIRQLSEAEMENLSQQLNPSILKNLKGNYGDKRITDLPTAILKVTITDQTEKKIRDYGKSGSPELEKLYQTFEDLKHAPGWSKLP